MYVEFSNPLREKVETTAFDPHETWFSDENIEPMTGSSTVPVRYTNRTSLGRATGYQFDGDYFLRLNADLGEPKLTTRYRILTVVSGTPETGPRYLAGSAGNATPTVVPTPTATNTPDSTQATAGSATSAATPGTVSASQTSAESGGVGALTITLILVAAVGASGLAVFVMRARWRRAASKPQGPQT